jgi:hypothetical protein
LGLRHGFSLPLRSFLYEFESSNWMMKSFKVFFLYKVESSNWMMKSFKVFLYKVQTSN